MNCKKWFHFLVAGVSWLDGCQVWETRASDTHCLHISTAFSPTSDTKEEKMKRQKTFSWTQEAMCWSTLTSLSTFGLRKAREKYWIGLGTGKPVSEYSYWGSRSSVLVALDKLVKGQVAHMLRLCCAAQLAGVAACLSTHSPGRGRRSATWAPPFNRSLRRQLLSRLTPRSSR